MALDKNDKREFDKIVKEKGYRNATGFPGYIDNDGNRIRTIGDSVKIDDIRYTHLTDVKKSGRV